jgi:hypothetical protein
MASELRVDTLKDASGNNSVATSTVASGSAKVWADVDMTGTAELTTGSFNVTGITDNGTGDVTLTINADMANANYACSGMTGAVASFDDEGSPHIISRAEGTVRFGITDVHNAADAVDIDPCTFIIHGDLA